MSGRHLISDNAAGIHPRILESIASANQGHEAAYGHDSWTIKAQALFQRHFGDNIETFFVLTGTGANVIALQSVLSSFEAVICSDSAHLNMDECAAAENFIGCKVLTAKNRNGKIAPAVIEPLLRDTATEDDVRNFAKRIKEVLHQA